MKQVLFVCTENAARSQIAEGLLRYLGKDEFKVMSVGLEPAPEVNPSAITVLRERGIDPAGMHSKAIDDELLQEEFDLVVTVCDHAKEHCPVFPNAKATLHWSLPDPAESDAKGDILLDVFRDTRREVEKRIKAEIL